MERRRRIMGDEADNEPPPPRPEALPVPTAPPVPPAFGASILGLGAAPPNPEQLQFGSMEAELEVAHLVMSRSK